MNASPRERRLRSDFEAMSQLQAESSILRFTARGTPADHYLVTFRGPGTVQDPETRGVVIRHEHVVSIGLTAAYPRMIPELTWKTPIFHPNISASGVVCLGGYQTNWVPSLKLDELCQMLWDMLRYVNYDTESPYNREAAVWAREQTARFPLDNRSLRDLAKRDGLRAASNPLARSGLPTERLVTASSEPLEAEVLFLDAEIVEAEVLDPDADSDVLFID